MLKTRVLSALVFTVVLGAIIITLPPWVVGVVLAILLLYGAMEWARLTGWGTMPKRLAYSSIVLVLISILFIDKGQSWSQWVVTLGAVGWFLIICLLAFYQRSEAGVPRWQYPLALSGLFLIPAAWLSMFMLEEQDFRLLLFMFVLGASADTFAYFTGKRFGRNKLAPELSPGKTREGVLGGLAGVMFVSVLFAMYMDMPPGIAVPFVLLCLVCGLVSVSGDLFESLMKREAGFKDSGSIMPGHGGILDRFDSHIAVAPVFVTGLQWIHG